MFVGEISWPSSRAELERDAGGGAPPAPTTRRTTDYRDSAASAAQNFSEKRKARDSGSSFLRKGRLSSSMTVFRNWFGTTSTPSASAASADSFDMNSPAYTQDLDRTNKVCRTHGRKIQRNQIRLIVFNEHDQRLLYDSETVISTEDRNMDDAHRSSCGRFQFLRHRADVPQIGRMVFGTLPTSSKSGALKIHSLPYTNSVMFSRVFFVPKSSKLNSPYNELKCMSSSFGSDSDCQSQHYATVRSLDTIRDDYKAHGRKNMSVDPPRRFQRIRNSSLQLDEDDAILEEVRVFSPSRLSRYRRKQLSLRGLANDGPAYRWGSRSRMSSCSSLNDTADDIKQIGFALLFDAQEKDFLFHHIIQVEKEIVRLEATVYKATLSKTQFFHLVYRGYCHFSDAICLLHNSMRLKQPAWLGLTDPNMQSEIATVLCPTMAKLINLLDQKESRFFLSTLLSSVLMNHLAWVASVAAPDSQPSDGVNKSLLLGTSVVDSSRHPYNARLAQFLELFGVVGVGDRLAKTVVIGKDVQMINDLLFVLSYFIRCSNVEQMQYEVVASSSRPVNAKNTVVGSLRSNEQSEFDDFMTDVSSSITSQHAGYQDLVRSGLHGISTATQPLEFQCPHSVRTKRPSTSQNACSPVGTVHNGLDNFGEPPSKTRAIISHEDPDVFHSKQKMEFIVDAEDIQRSGQEIAPNVVVTHQTTVITASCSSPDANSPTSSSQSTQSAATSVTSSDLGRSLLAGVCTSYSPHFVLSGIDLRECELEKTFNAIYEDVKHPTGEPCEQFLSLSLPSSLPLNQVEGRSPPLKTNIHGLQRENSNLEHANVAHSSRLNQTQLSFEGPNQAVVVVGDLTTYSVRVVSGRNCKVDDQLMASPSESVVAMLEQFLQLYRLSVNPTFMISFLEDKLSSLLTKSNTLVKLMTDFPETAVTTCALHDTQSTTNYERQRQIVFDQTAEPKSDVFREPAPPNLTISRLRNLSVVSVPSVPSPSSTGNVRFLHRSCAQSDYNSIPPTISDAADDDLSNTSTNLLSMQRVCDVVGCDCSDLRLIINVAAVYQPSILHALVI